MKVRKSAHDTVLTLRLTGYVDEEIEAAGEVAPQTSQESEPVDGPTSQKDVSPEPPIVVTGGRRRGRRKVMKKKTIKDDEGYLGLYF